MLFLLTLIQAALCSSGVYMTSRQPVGVREDSHYAAVITSSFSFSLIASSRSWGPIGSIPLPLLGVLPIGGGRRHHAGEGGTRLRAGRAQESDIDSKQCRQYRNITKNRCCSYFINEKLPETTFLWYKNP
jgi:hypothetical protein